MTRKALILLIVTTLLVIVLVFSATGNCMLWLNAKSITQQVNTYRYNEKVLEFTKMFIALVLKADGEVSFEDRLKLENTVRAIGDESILLRWNKFVGAPNEEVEKEAKNLFQLLLDKINQ